MPRSKPTRLAISCKHIDEEELKEVLDFYQAPIIDEKNNDNDLYYAVAEFPSKNVLREAIRAVFRRTYTIPLLSHWYGKEFGARRHAIFK